MKLNQKKCVTVVMNGKGRPEFKDGTPIKKESDTVYLGSHIDVYLDT